MKGANHPRISKTELMDFNIAIPPKDVQKDVANIIEQVRESGLNIMIDSLGNLFDEYRKSILYHAFIGAVGDSSSDKNPQISASITD